MTRCAQIEVCTKKALDFCTRPADTRIMLNNTNTAATVFRLTYNARTLGKEAQHLAAALSLLGVDAIALCVWCAEHVEGEAIRLSKGGECVRCPNVGRDVLCVVQEVA